MAQRYFPLFENGTTCSMLFISSMVMAERWAATQVSGNTGWLERFEAAVKGQRKFSDNRNSLYHFLVPSGNITMPCTWPRNFDIAWSRKIGQAT